MRLPFVLAAAAFSLSACASRTPNELSLVEVPLIIGALKCAFATALLKENEPGNIKRLEGSVAAGTLSLKLVYTNSQDFSIKGKATAGGPFVFTYAGATGSILPNFSSSVVRTNTITTDIDFRYYMYATNDDVCDNVGADTQARYGFSKWLADVIAGVDANANTYPLGQLDQVKYSQEFGVVRTTKGGVDFDVVFLSGSASASSTRNDVQSLKFTIAPVSKENPLPEDVWSKR